MRHLYRTIGLTLGVAGLVLAGTLPVVAAWELAHGNPANSGFVDVLTSPAGSGSRSVPGLGTFAFVAGPVVAPDGTVYVGTLEGKVIALHADGSPFWSREITQGQSIVSSPAVGADGTVYVVGSKRTLIRDHRGETVITRVVFETMLHRFTPGGGWIGQTPFPNHEGRGRTTAPLNIARIGGLEVVLVPVIHSYQFGGSEIRLAGFSTTGAIVIDQRVAYYPAGPVIGGSDRPSWMDWSCLVPVIGWPICLGGNVYHPPPSTDPLPTVPGVAVFTPPDARHWIIVNDQAHDVVGYNFSSNATLTENFRLHDEKHKLTSTPMVLPDGHTLVGTAEESNAGGIVFTRPNGIKLPTVAGLGAIYAAPTGSAKGHVVVIGSKGLALLEDAKVLSRTALPSESYVSAAASRTHVFVSTRKGLLTFDADAQALLLTFDWLDGGMSPPAIGPQGHVYAIASNVLFVFPPPRG